MLGGSGSPYRNASSFNYMTASFLKGGAWDDAVVYDSTGAKYEVEAIELTKPGWVYWFLDRAGHFFILPRKNAEPMARVDMVLREVSRLDFVAFRNELRSTVLSNPKWWRRYSTESEVISMFEACTSYEAVIECVGVREPSLRHEHQGASKKIVDLR